MWLRMKKEEEEVGEAFAISEPKVDLPGLTGTWINCQSTVVAAEEIFWCCCES